MTAVTFTGLSSGIDTSSLVNQLVASERAPATAIASRQSDLSTQKSIVGSLSSALAALATATRGMDIASELQPRAFEIHHLFRLIVHDPRRFDLPFRRFGRIVLAWLAGGIHAAVKHREI